MSGKKTFIILLIFAVLAGVYYLDQKRVSEKTTREEAESRLVLPEQKDLTQLSIKASGETTRLEKQGEDWRLTAPIQSRVDRSTLDGILAELDRAKKKESFEAAEAALKDYGLADPPIVVDLQASGKNYVQQFTLGADTPDASEVYVRIGKENKIYTLPTSLKTQLQKTPLDLRDKRPIPANVPEATSITLASTTSTVQLARREGAWQIADASRARADEAKVTEILNEISGAKRSDYISSPSASLAQYGLDKPAWTASLYVAGTDPRSSASLRTLKLGAVLPSDSAKRYAMLEGEPDVFALPDSLLSKARPSLDDLRAKELYTIKPEDVGRVTFGVRDRNLAVEKDSAGQWKIVGEPDTKLNQGVVASKVDQLLRLKAKSFLTAEPDAAKSGLSEPNLRLSVTNKAGTTTETVLTGRKDDSADFVYALKPDTRQYLTVEWTEPGNFFVTHEELIDKTLFNFSQDDVQKMDVRDGTRTLTLTRTGGGGWEGEIGGKRLQVEAPKMTALLYGMAGLAWDRTLNAKLESEAVLIKTQKLENPAREVVLYKKDNSEAARLGFGGEESRYAYIRAGKDAYYAIDKARLATVSEGINNVLGGGPATPPAPGIMGPGGMQP